MHKLTTDEFINRARLAHDEKYDYGKTEYVDAKTKVVITCSRHGDFNQVPYSHLIGNGCPECAIDKRRSMYASNKEEFVTKAKEVHGDFYNYDLVEYTNARTKVKIVCPNHGQFEQTPNAHLSRHGCERCSQDASSINTFKPNENNKKDGCVLYLVVFDFDNAAYEKVGITRSSINRRFKIKGVDNLKIIHTVKSTYEQCYEIEQIILNEYSDRRFRLRKRLRENFCGWTETFKDGTMDYEFVVEQMNAVFLNNPITSEEFL